jgi:hypothetical protein
MSTHTWAGGGRAPLRRTQRPLSGGLDTIKDVGRQLHHDVLPLWVLEARHSVCDGA